MKKSDAGEKLRGIRKIDSLIKRKIEQIEKLRSMSAYSAQNYSHAGGGKTNHHADKMAGIVSRIADIEREIERDTERMLELKFEVMKMIDSLDNADMIDILYMRYFEFRQWDDISRDLDKSLQWVFELNRRAIHLLNNVQL